MSGPKTSLLLLIVVACVGKGAHKMPTPADWRTLNLADRVSFAVPNEAVAQDIQPIDSVFGVLRATDCEIIYDYGRSGEDLAALKTESGYSQRNRRIDNRSAEEVSVTSQESPPRIVRILQVQDGAKLLTIRVSCQGDENSSVAQTIFDSVKFSGAR